MAQPDSVLDREYARWLGRVESRAILPMKWGILLISGIYWLWLHDWELPSTLVFSIFFIYGASTAAQHYLFWRDRISSQQVRPVVYTSYVVDLVFITAMIWLDSRNQTIATTAVGPSPVSDYYLLYFLLILRGFALFRTPMENLVMASLISLIILASMAWYGEGLGSGAAKAILLRIALIWAIMVLATFIIDIVNKQKDEVIRVRERLVRSEGLAALGELAAGVAHEINNPIGIIKTYAEYLKKAVPEDDPTHDDFSTIHKEAERCETIVRRMLDFANPNVKGMEEFDVGGTVREVVEFVFHKKGADNFKVETDIPDGLPPILGDPQQVRQAILNIVMNARQVLKDSSKPEIGVRVRQMPGPRAPIEISVHDNGPGISPEDAEHAFEPFFTRRDGGTGLGLAITRRIIEAHGGSIDIWPAANGGTSVAITFPIAGESD
ncbi:hypothetical protein KQI84_03330 [bacterium]|nr:hypothetical protein [bacterium]